MKELYSALVHAQTKAQAVAKDSRNEFHRYAYASTEAIIEEARVALSAAGLALFPGRWALVADGAGNTTVKVEYHLAHTSGESQHLEVEMPVVPEKGRPIDKALATALTCSMGYLLRGLLLLPRVDPATEMDKRDDRDKEHRPAKANGVAVVAAPVAPGYAAPAVTPIEPPKAEAKPEVPSLGETFAEDLAKKILAAKEVQELATLNGEAVAAKASGLLKGKGLTLVREAYKRAHSAIVAASESEAL